MKKHYFELDKVESITLTYENETSYRWMPSIPARPKTFLGIEYSMRPGIIGGWNDSFDENGNEYNKNWRKQSSYFENYSWYFEKRDRIYIKAHVEIRLGYKQSFGVYFESNEEAQEYVNDLIESSDKVFHVIVNK